METEHDTSVPARSQRGRIWIDGCFDFSHHGHAGAMLQARRLGMGLYVGVHSDEEILEHKGPTVMTLDERIAAVNACRWSTASVPSAPYVTQLSFIDKYGCHYVVHGDDITSDSGGEDCYRFVKAAGRFLVVKRTPSISTTDLVGRMLLCTRSHFIGNLRNVLNGEEETLAGGTLEERKALGEEMAERIKEYATDESGLKPGAEVWNWLSDDHKSDEAEAPNRNGSAEAAGSWARMVSGKAPKSGQRLVYVDGGFDLFCSGHIEFLRQVVLAEEALGQKNGWFEIEAVAKRKLENGGEDYAPAFVMAGVHDDAVINYWKGVNYPIMNIFERGLCVLQCKYIQALLLSVPFVPTTAYLHAVPYGLPQAVYHGPTSFMSSSQDPYADAKSLGIFREVEQHAFQEVNASEIVGRIMKNRERYEERQRAKGVKGVGEEDFKRKEMELLQRKGIPN